MMKNPLTLALPRLALTIAAAASLLASAQSASAQTPVARAQAFLDELYRTTGNISIAFTVISKGELVFSRAVGYANLESLTPATTATVYNIGSVSKSIAAVAVMQLVEQGKVSLYDPIQRYVPSFPDKRWPVTIRHILTHTSGIRHYRDDDFPRTPGGENVMPIASLEEGIKIFKDDALLFEPGEYYHYSSYAVNLLQGVVESVSGMSFEDYLKEHVWEPAGMLHTGFDIPERVIPGRARSYYIEDGLVKNYPYGDLTYKFAGGGMISTAEDLARFAVAVIHGRLLSPETVQQMFTVQLEKPTRFYEDGPPEQMSWDQLLMWRIRLDSEGRPYVNQCGSVKGFNACIVIYPEADLIATCVVNAQTGRPGLQSLYTLANFFREPEVNAEDGT